MSNDRIVIREPRLDLGSNREVPRDMTGEQAYDWLGIHHPRSNAEAVRRDDPSLVDRGGGHVDGELESLQWRGDRNGVPLVRKDLILENTSGSRDVMIPNPVAGYAYLSGDSTNSISIYDRPRDQPGAELVGQVLHGERNSSPFTNGEFVPYGAPLVRQSDVGSPGAVHAHIELEPEQYKRYLGDVLSERINTQRYPEGQSAPEAPRPADALADGLLKRDDRGPKVEELQRVLTERGFDTQGVDGKFGQNTHNAVEAFQRANGLKVDGVVGEDTARALGISLTRETPAPVTPEPATPTPVTPAPTTPAPTTPSPSVPSTDPANVPPEARGAYNAVQDWHLGQTSAHYETGNRGPGFISSGVGDHGGKSYGIYQLSSTQGSLAEYVGQSERYGAEFRGLTPASPEFDARWREVAQRDPQGFANDQHEFIKTQFFDVQNASLQAQGIDLSGRGRAVQDALWSTSVQFRDLTPRIFSEGMREAYGHTDVSRLTDQQIVSAVQDYKLNHNDTLFRSSPTLWPGLRDRAVNEKSDLLELAGAEQTLSRAGVSVPMDMGRGPSPDAFNGNRAALSDGVLDRGDRGPKVEELQRALTERGFDTQGTDGVFGRNTQNAVEAFQRANGLKVDGMVGEDTARALGISLARDTPAPAQPTPAPTDGVTAPAPTSPPADGRVPPTESAPQTPRIDQAGHPDNRLYTQAVSNLEQLGPNGGFESREQMERAAAALAADAKLTGLGQIDHVARSRNGEGLIAVQGNDPWAPDAKRAFLDVSQATSQTLEQSTQMADSKKQDSVATPQPTAPERAVATEQSNPVLIADEPQRSSGVRLA